MRIEQVRRFVMRMGIRDFFSGRAWLSGSLRRVARKATVRRCDGCLGGRCVTMDAGPGRRAAGGGWLRTRMLRQSSSRWLTLDPVPLLQPDTGLLHVLQQMWWLS